MPGAANMIRRMRGEWPPERGISITAGGWLPRSRRPMMAFGPVVHGRTTVMKTTRLASGLGALIWAMPAARAADYPARSVNLVVAFTPGGPSDVLARILGKKLEQILGQPFIIENRPGAGGNVAAEAVARAAP